MTKVNIASDLELDQPSILRVGSPSIHVFQVNKDWKRNKASNQGDTLTVYPSDPPYFTFIDPRDGNVLDFSLTFDKERSGITVRLVDTDLSLFQRFFSSNNIIDKVRKSYFTSEDSLASVAASIINQEWGDYNIPIQNANGQEQGEEDEERLTVLSVLGQIAKNTFVSDFMQEERNDQMIFESNKVPVDFDSTMAFGNIFDKDAQKLNAVVSEAFRSNGIRHFVAQISDGINHSLHFDVYLDTLKLSSNSDSHLIVELFFTFGAEDREILRNSVSLGKVTGATEADTFSHVGLCNVEIKHYLDLSRRTVPLKLGSFASVDPQPLVKAKCRTSILDDTQNRFKKLGRVLEACISSYLADNDSNHNVANVLTFLSPQLPATLTRKIKEREKEIEEASQTRAYKQDATGRYIKAVTDVLHDLGFRVSYDEYGTSDRRGPAKPWEDCKKTIYVRIDGIKLFDAYGATRPEPNTFTARKAIVAFVNAMYLKLGINSSVSIQEVPTFLHKDLLIQTMYKDRNPLYWEGDDSKNFPREKRNSLLSVANSRLFSQPMVMIMDKSSSNYINLTATQAKIQSARVTVSQIDIPRTNVEVAFKEGWGSTSLFDKIETPKEMLRTLVTTPAFIYNAQGGNVVDFTVLESNFATAMFKLKPPAFANRVLLSAAGAAAQGRFDAAVDAIEDVLVTSDFLKRKGKYTTKNKSINSLDQLDPVRSQDLARVNQTLDQFVAEVLPKFRDSRNSSDGLIKSWLETTVLSNLQSEIAKYRYVDNYGKLQDTFVQLYKEVFDEFIRKFSTKGVSLSGFLEYLTFMSDLQKFSHVLSVRTTPMFHLSHHEVINGACVFYGKIAKSPNDTLADYDILDNGFLKDMIFNGVYEIVEFKHVVNNGEAYSEFKLVKNTSDTGIKEVVSEEYIQESGVVYPFEMPEDVELRRMGVEPFVAPYNR